MKQFLRSFLTLLMLVVWASGFAQEVTLDFTNAASDWKIPTDYQKTSTQFTNGTYTISLASPKDGYKVNESGVILGKEGATLTLPAFDFDVEKIIVRKNTSSVSKKVTQNIFVGNQAVSTETTGANNDQTYSIKEAFQKAGTIYVLKVTNGNNTQFSKIEIYKKASTKTLTSLAISGEPTKKTYNDGEAFDPTGLVVTGTYDDNTTATITNGITWATTPATLTVGTTSCSVTATVNGVTSPAYEVAGLTVKKAITLSIDPATSTVVKAPVKVTLTANAGATIYYTLNGDEPTTTSTKYTAPFEVTKSGTTVKALAVAEGAENAKAEAQYTIQPEQPVFSDESKTFKDAFNVTLSLPESTDPTSTIHYAIGKDATAKSPLYEGPINISAENDGDKVILRAVVVDPYGNVGQQKYCTYTKTTAIVFDFTRAWEGITPLEENQNQSGDNVVAGKELKVDGIVMTATNGGSTTCLYGSKSDHDLRVYKGGGSITFTAPEGYNIKEVVFSGNNTKDFTTKEPKYTNPTWSGNAHEVTFSAKSDAKTIKLNTATIKLVATTLPLDETTTAEDAKTLLGANLNKTVDVTINRTLVANKWNTLCLPFDVTAEQIKNILKAEGMVREYADEDVTNQTIIFKKVEGNMIAGVPYLIKPTEDITSLAFEGVTITETEGNCKGNIYSIWGTFGKYDMLTDGTELFLNAAGKFVAPAAATNTMKGFRAYFMVPSGASAAAININIDGETTGINNIETEATVKGKVYNLNGQYVGNSLNGLKKGIYVVNGKKVIK